MKGERPSTAGLNSTITGGRQFETFSKQHREKLAMGEPLGQSRKGRSKARITVVVRKRPLSQAEASRNEIDILSLAPASKTTMKVDEPRKNVCGIPYTESHDFNFDRAYSHEHTNTDVYKSCVRQLVDAVFNQGARCSCFTYGQTGSGKTFTMCGPERLGSNQYQNSGLLELAAYDCFKWLQTPEFDYHFGLYVSFFEIYCNKVYDLLGERRLVKALETKTSDGVVVKDLTTVKVDKADTLLRTVAVGLDLRVVGQNSKNNDSSRGHAVLTLEVRNEHTQTNFGKLAFIDLAGSERGADAMFSGKQTQTDGAGINRSLLALKECIRALDQQNSHVPFRDSELTKVLRDMFIGSKARTLMISCVSPSSGCCEQTLNTLRYAERVKGIRKNCQPDVETSDTSENTKFESKSLLVDGAFQRRRYQRRHEHSTKSKVSDKSRRRHHQKREDLTERNTGDGAQRSETHQNYSRSASCSEEQDRCLSVTDSEDVSDDDSDRKSSMLSLGTSHDSAEFEQRNRGMITSDSEDTVGQTPPLSTRTEEEPLKRKLHSRSKTSVSNSNEDHNSEVDLASPKGKSNRIVTTVRSRATEQPSGHLINRISGTMSPLLRGIEPRLAASCFDPDIAGESSPPGLASSVIPETSSFLRHSLAQRPRPSSGSLAADTSQHLSSTSLSRRTTAAGGNFLSQRRDGKKDLPSTGHCSLISSGRACSAVRDQLHSTRSVNELARVPLMLDSLGTTQEPSVNHSLTRTQCAAKSEISKFLPKPEPNDHISAVTLLRKRYRDFDFPIQPPKGVPTDGKHLDISVAMDMLDTLLQMPATDIHNFYEKYTGKMQQFYTNLVQAHMDFLKAHTCAGMTQQKMLKEIYSSQRNQKRVDIDRQYLTNLRTTLEHQLLLQLSLGKRLGEMERMLALQRTIVKGFQAASASEVEYFPFNTLQNSYTTESNAISPPSLPHSTITPITSRLLKCALPGATSTPLLRSSLVGKEYALDTNIPSARTPLGGAVTTTTTAASLRTIEEYAPMLSSNRERSSTLTPRSGSIEGPKLRATTSIVAHDSRPLQPPTALSLEGSSTRLATTTILRRRDAEPEIGPDGFPIPSDITNRVNATTTTSTTSSVRRSRRSRKMPVTDVDVAVEAPGTLVASVKEALAQSSGSTRASRRTSRRT